MKPRITQQKWSNLWGPSKGKTYWQRIRSFGRKVNRTMKAIIPLNIFNEVLSIRHEYNLYEQGYQNPSEMILYDERDGMYYINPYFGNGKEEYY